MVGRRATSMMSAIEAGGAHLGLVAVRQGDVQRVGHARASLLGRASCALSGQLDAQPLPAHRAEGFGMQPELPGQEVDRRSVARAAGQNQPRRALSEQLDRG